MSQGIGEQMAKECNVSCAEDFVLSVTVSVDGSLGTELAQLGGSVKAHRLDTVKLLQEQKTGESEQEKTEKGAPERECVCDR